MPQQHPSYDKRTFCQHSDADTALHHTPQNAGPPYQHNTDKPQCCKAVFASIRRGIQTRLPHLTPQSPCYILLHMLQMTIILQRHRDDIISLSRIKRLLPCALHRAQPGLPSQCLRIFSKLQRHSGQYAPGVTQRTLPRHNDLPVFICLNAGCRRFVKAYLYGCGSVIFL